MLKTLRKILGISCFNESKHTYIQRKEYDQRYITGDRKGVKW